MKLFIWEGAGVLTDYTDGMIVAMAGDLAAAHRAISKEDSVAVSNYPANPTETVDLGPIRKRPRAWVMWGGG